MLLTYRTCPQETFGDPNRWFRPDWFSKTKCLKNALSNFNDPDIEFIFVYDGDNSEWLDFIGGFNKPIIRFNYKENQKSLIALYETIKDKIGGHDSFYLLEDDYLHIPNSYKVLKESLRYTGLSTIYHHPDRFTRTDDSFQETSIWATDTEYYRVMESTTGTFAGTKEFLDKFYDDMIKFNIYDRDFFRNCIDKGTKLACPVNTYSTHVHTHFLSKFVDWVKINSHSSSEKP
jgi:hypothetical protein